MKDSANNSCTSRVTVRVFYLANDPTLNNSLNDQVRLHYQSSSLHHTKGQGWRSSLLPSAPSVALVARYDTRSVWATSCDSKGQTSWRHLSQFLVSLHLHIPPPFTSLPSYLDDDFIPKSFLKINYQRIYLRIHINTPHRLSR